MGGGPPRRHTRIDVPRRGEGDLPRQAVLAAVVRTPELAERLVADDGQYTAREVGAVLDDRHAHSAVTEATWLELHVEAERQGVAGPERLLESVDVVTELLVRDHATESAIERHARLDIESRLHMHRVDGRCAPIHEPVAAADRRSSPVGMDLDVQIRADTHGLRNTLVLAEPTLVF